MAIRFDAATDRLTTTTNLPAAGVYTVLCWVRIVNDRNDYSNAIHIQGSFGRKVALAFDSDGATLRALDDELAGPTSGTALTVGAWYATAATVNTATCNLYWGTSASGLSNNTDTGFVPDTSAGATMYLGSNPFDFWLDGELANVKVYDAALSQAEIETELASYTVTRTANLLHCYSFQGGALTDSSGNGNTLTAGSTSTTAVDGPPALDQQPDSLRVPIQTIRIP